MFSGVDCAAFGAERDPTIPNFQRGRAVQCFSVQSSLSGHRRSDAVCGINLGLPAAHVSPAELTLRFIHDLLDGTGYL